jgi:hypothetical protein
MFPCCRETQQGLQGIYILIHGKKLFGTGSNHGVHIFARLVLTLFLMPGAKYNFFLMGVMMIRVDSVITRD